MIRALPGKPIPWPKGCRFAFSIFDDPDEQPPETTRLVYSFLADLGFRTTIGVWPLDIRRRPNSPGETCANPDHRSFLQDLQRKGFEIGFHHAAPHSCTRNETIESLDLFQSYFGGPPSTMANHYNMEALYWGPNRLGGWRRSLYNLATLGTKRERFFGHVEGHSSFWGDVCYERINYCRNFTFAEINTLRACPWTPYRDPLRPYVRHWYSSTDGADGKRFIRMLQTRNQDRLEDEGGACIMYTHFGHGFVEHGKLKPQFCKAMESLAARKGWFVPVSKLLDFLVQFRGVTVLDENMRKQLEARWLREKLFRGSA